MGVDNFSEEEMFSNLTFCKIFWGYSSAHLYIFAWLTSLRTVLWPHLRDLGNEIERAAMVAGNR